MLAHGVSTGALFILVGMIYERRHTKKISEFGGVASSMPVFASFFILFALASIGLPLLNGFVGEFLVLLGAFKKNYLYAVFAGSGIILGAIYMLKAVQKVFFGPADKPENRELSDINKRETAVLLPIAAIIIFMGVYPQPLLSRIEPGAKQFIAQFSSDTVGKKSNGKKTWESRKP